MQIRYFLSNAFANLTQLFVLTVLSVFMSNADFGIVREFVAVFLVICTLSQLGLTTSLVSNWRKLKYKYELSIVISFIMLFASVIASYIYFDDDYNRNLIALSVFLYSAPLVIAAMHQSYSNHNSLLFFQNYPKVIFYFTLAILMIFLDLNVYMIFCSTALGIFFIGVLYKVKKDITITKFHYGAISEILLLVKRTVVPFILTFSGVLLQNFEFVLLSENTHADELGAFSKVSLIYSGMVALLFSIQNRSLSAFAEQGLVKTLVKEETARLIIMSVVGISTVLFLTSCVSEYIRSYLLYDVYSSLLWLVMLKLLLWSCFAVPGILIYHLGYNLVCLLLAVGPILFVSVMKLFGVQFSINQLVLCSCLLMFVSLVVVNYIVFFHHLE